MTSLQPVGRVPAGNSRGPLVVAALLVVAIGLALLKPWAVAPAGPAPTLRNVAVGGAATFGPASNGPTTPSAPPSPARTPASNISGPCYYGLAWRLFTTDTTNNGLVHSWYGIQPVRAASPDDGTIPVVDVHSRTLGQLGYCLQEAPDSPAPVLRTLAWLLPAGGPAQAVELVPTGPGGGLAPGQGAIFLPPAIDSGPRPAAWAPAVYVFEIELAATPGAGEWFAVRVG